MELSKKTTILFSRQLHQHLKRLARRRGTSIGSLVREACERQYGFESADEKLQAVEALRRLALPVGSPADMKRQSVPSPEELMP
ncbi:hypothetical protein ACFL59_16520 [Planctomycetota bacterium]